MLAVVAAGALSLMLCAQVEGPSGNPHRALLCAPASFLPRHPEEGKLSSREEQMMIVLCVLSVVFGEKIADVFWYLVPQGRVLIGYDC